MVWRNLFAAVLVALAFAVSRAAAAPVTYDFSLTPTDIGPDSPFGISSLPAGPFTGFFSIDDSDLAVDAPLSIRTGDLLDFSATVGDTTWLLGDVLEFSFAVSGGEVSSFGLHAAIDLKGLRVFSSLWSGTDGVAGCGTSFSPGCITGHPADTISFARRSTSIPEPASLVLFGAGLFGLALRRRQARRA